MPEATPAAGSNDALQLEDGHGTGPCMAHWSRSDRGWLHTTAGVDARICMREGPQCLLQKAGSNTDDVGFHCLAVTPDGKLAVTGDEAYAKARQQTHPDMRTPEALTNHKKNAIHTLV